MSRSISAVIAPGANGRRLASEIEHGGFDADPTRSVVKDKFDLSLQVLVNVLRSRGRDMFRAICRRCGKRLTVCDKRPCPLVFWHSYADGISARSDDVRNLVALFENYRERSGHKALGKFIKLVGNIHRNVLDLFKRRYMHYKRIVAGSALRLENLCHGVLVKCVCSESVYGFRRENNESALVYDLRAFVYAVACFYDFRYHL